MPRKNRRPLCFRGVLNRVQNGRLIFLNIILLPGEIARLN